MGFLNEIAYVVEKDRLIYDAKHPIDATAVEVAITYEVEGMLKRGQLLDYAEGTFSIHAKNGTPSVIVAEDTEYASDMDSVTVAVYTSGSFRASEVIADPEITAAEAEVLRGKGIYLK